MDTTQRQDHAKGQTAPEILAKAQRHAYLHQRGIVPGDGGLQLSLLFPEVIGRDDLRHVPNDYARSALFTARNKREPRKTLVRERIFHVTEHVSIVYTGIELRADDDELVWLQILKYGETVPLGQPFEFDVKDLVADVGWTKNGRNYDRVRVCISRLKANEVLAKNDRAYGSSGAISLISQYTATNDGDGKATRYRVWIDPNLVTLFAGHTFTSHAWGVYRDMTPVARRLTDYIESHQHPFPLSVETFRRMCGSTDANPRSWRQTVRKACAEVQDAGIASMVMVDKQDRICCLRK